MIHTQVCVTRSPPLPPPPPRHGTFYSAIIFFQVQLSPTLKPGRLKAIVWINLPSPPTHIYTYTYAFPSVIQRTRFLTCIFHFTLPTPPLPLTDTTQGRGASDIDSGNPCCDPELLTECLLFIAT